VCLMRLSITEENTVSTQTLFEQAGFQFPQSLAERYQPKTVEQFVGLDKPKKIMAKFADNPYPSAWLFVGPSGTGKTSMALAICNAVAGELHHIPSQSCDLATVKAVVTTTRASRRLASLGNSTSYWRMRPTG
jgi:replication-associated recombination protein RarA